MKTDIVTFTSDYGLEDEFVGVCRGVMLKIAPQLRVVDLHHYILRQDVRHGAVVLQQSLRFLPEAIHLAIVDPTVGSDRLALALETSSGQVLVGPDNGLLMPAAEEGGGIERVVSITNEKYLLTPVSNTFQGRDVFAPVAAHLANGIEVSELGEEISPADLVTVDIPQAWVHDDHLHAEVLQVDRFGNLQLNVDRELLSSTGLDHGDGLEIRLEGHRLCVPFGESFSDVKAGDYVLVEDSYNQLSLAINKGDARARLRAGARSTAIVGPLT